MKNIHKHIEWMVFLGGLTLMAAMSPYEQGFSFCLFDLAGFDFCPGEGLGHSIAFLFRGELKESFSANLMGPVAVVVLSLRIASIWKDLFKKKIDLTEENNG